MYIFSFRSRRCSTAVQIHATHYILYCCNPCANDPFAGNVFWGGDRSGDCGGGERVYIVKSNSRFREILDDNIYPNLTELTIAATTKTAPLNVANTDQRLRSIILLKYFPNLYICLLYN